METLCDECVNCVAVLGYGASRRALSSRVNEEEHGKSTLVKRVVHLSTCSQKTKFRDRIHTTRHYPSWSFESHMYECAIEPLHTSIRSSIGDLMDRASRKRAMPVFTYGGMRYGCDDTVAVYIFSTFLYTGSCHVFRFVSCRKFMGFQASRPAHAKGPFIMHNIMNIVHQVRTACIKGFLERNYGQAPSRDRSMFDTWRRFICNAFSIQIE